MIPLCDQAVSEGQTGSGVRGRLVAVEHATRERRLDMAHDFFLEVLGGREGLRAVLLPGSALVLGDGSCDGGKWCESMVDKLASGGK
jgi:hypothetical protein